MANPRVLRNAACLRVWSRILLEQSAELIEAARRTQDEAQQACAESRDTRTTVAHRRTAWIGAASLAASAANPYAWYSLPTRTSLIEG